MLFRHHVHNAVYTLRAADISTIFTQSGIPMHSKVTPIRAEFQNHYFDSATIKDDEEREALEQHLMSSSDFNRAWNLGAGGLYLDEREQAALTAELEKDTIKVVGPAEPVAACIYTIPTPQGAELCGEAVVKDGDYCADHAKLMEVPA